MEIHLRHTLLCGGEYPPPGYVPRDDGFTNKIRKTSVTVDRLEKGKLHPGHGTNCYEFPGYSHSEASRGNRPGDSIFNQVTPSLVVCCNFLHH